MAAVWKYAVLLQPEARREWFERSPNVIRDSRIKVIFECLLSLCATFVGPCIEHDGMAPTQVPDRSCHGRRTDCTTLESLPIDNASPEPLTKILASGAKAKEAEPPKDADCNHLAFRMECRGLSHICDDSEVKGKFARVLAMRDVLYGHGVVHVDDGAEWPSIEPERVHLDHPGIAMHDRCDANVSPRVTHEVRNPLELSRPPQIDDVSRAHGFVMFKRSRKLVRYAPWRISVLELHISFRRPRHASIRRHSQLF